MHEHVHARGWCGFTYNHQYQDSQAVKSSMVWYGTYPRPQHKTLLPKGVRWLPSIRMTACACRLLGAFTRSSGTPPCGTASTLTTSVGTSATPPGILTSTRLRRLRGVSHISQESPRLFAIIWRSALKCCFAIPQSFGGLRSNAVLRFLVLCISLVSDHDLLFSLCSLCFSLRLLISCLSWVLLHSVRAGILLVRRTRDQKTRWKMGY